MHFNLIDKYQEINNNMVFEGKLAKLNSNLYESYYEYSKNLGNKNKENLYLENHKLLTNALERLDKTIISKDSKILYKGLKNTINNVMEICEEGLDAARENDLITTREKYLEATSVNNFVQQNTGNLVLKELEYVENLQEKINATHKLSITFVVVFLILVVIFSITIGLITVNRLTQPLIHLTAMSEKVAKGNLDEMAGPDLIERKDEIGTLSQSFNAMIFEIKNRINAQEEESKNSKAVKGKAKKGVV